MLKNPDQVRPRRAPRVRWLAAPVALLALAGCGAKNLPYNISAATPSSTEAPARVVPPSTAVACPTVHYSPQNVDTSPAKVASHFTGEIREGIFADIDVFCSGTAQITAYQTAAEGTPIVKADMTCSVPNGSLVTDHNLEIDYYTHPKPGTFYLRKINATNLGRAACAQTDGSIPPQALTSLEDISYITNY